MADCHLDHGTHNLWADGAWERATSAIAEGGYYAALIAGDLFHTGQPVPEAVLRCATGLDKMTRAGVKVVMIAGNHEWQRIRSTQMHRPPNLIYNVMDNVTSVIHPEGILLGDDLWVGALPWPAPGSHASVLSQTEDALLLADEAEALDIPKIVVCHAAVEEAMHWHGSEAEMCTASTPSETVSLEALDQEVFTQVTMGHIHNRQSLSPTCSYVGGLEAFTFADENRIGAWSSFELVDETAPEFGWLETKMDCGRHRFKTVDVDADLSTVEAGTLIRVRIKDGQSRFDFNESQIEKYGLLFGSWKDERSDAEVDLLAEHKADDEPLNMPVSYG